MQEIINNDSIKLYLGKALDVLKEQENESIQLIYIDPPFATGKDFYTKKGEKAFSDKYTIEGLLEMLIPVIIEIKRVLKQEGSFYIHGDDNYMDYIKIECDKIFGIKNFINNIVRIKTKSKNSITREFGDITDRILFYVKDKNKYLFNPLFEERERDESELSSKMQDEKGLFYTQPLHGTGETKNGESGQSWNSSHGIIELSSGKHWGYSFEKMNNWDKNGEIHWSSTNNPRKKFYIDGLKKIRFTNLWDIKNGQSGDTLDYPTTKPERLLENIIKASSNPGDLVGDFFCGAGTTGAVALKLNRKFIGSDIGELAIKITNERLIKIPIQLTLDKK